MGAGANCVAGSLGAGPDNVSRVIAIDTPVKFWLAGIPQNPFGPEFAGPFHQRSVPSLQALGCRKSSSNCFEFRRDIYLVLECMRVSHGWAPIIAIERLISMRRDHPVPVPCVG